MKTKIFTLFLALAASVGTMTAGIIERVQIGDLYYNLNETDLTAEVTYNSEGYSGDIVIPATVTYNAKNYSVTSIEAGAFCYCYTLTSVTIPNSVTSIGGSAFYDCTSLTSPVYNAHVFAYLPTSYSGAYSIPSGIESIADGSFDNCTGLTSLTIPSSVISIGEGASWRCTSLASIIVQSGNAKYDSRDNCNAIIETSSNSLIAGCKNTIIANSVTSIGKWAFAFCTGLTSITIPNSITSIGEQAFRNDSSLVSVTIGNSVTSIGEKAFSDCESLTSVTVEPTTPPTLGEYCFSSNDSLSIYVPCGLLDTYKTASGWSSYAYASKIKYAPYPYTIETKAENGSVSTTSTDFTVCDEHLVTCTAQPYQGFYFVRWADGNTINPRTIELTQDTTMEAIFDYLLAGKCGKDSVLNWKLDLPSKALNITGKGALSEIYTYGAFIESLTIGNEVTSIGECAFCGFDKLKNVIIGSSVKVLEECAFCGCSAIETITCYSQRPPTVSYYALEGLDYSTIVYVPADYLDTYKMHDAWGLYDVRPLGAVERETEDVAVTPHDNTAEVVWPAVSGAATYELVIRDKDGNVICTLVFNSNGQLTSIAFAPARDNAPQQTPSSGFAFTVTGLNSGTGYDLTMTSKDSGGATLQTKTVSFTTTGDAPQGIDQITNDNWQMTNKIIKDGQIFILRGEKVYTLTSQEVK